MSTKPFSVLFIGIDKVVRQHIVYEFKLTAFKEISKASEFSDLIFNESMEEHDLIICGDFLENTPPGEIAQSLRTKVSESVPLFFVTMNLGLLLPKELIKNGFEKVFFLPADYAILDESVNSVMILRKNSTRKNLKPVSVANLGTDPLPFGVSIFLPMNNKFLKISNKGSDLKEEQLKKFKKSHINSVYIEQQDMDEYFKYVSSKLKNVANGNVIAGHDEQLKAKTVVRNLFLDIFSASNGTFDEGKNTISASQALLTQFIPQETDSLFNQLKMVMEDRADTYDHAFRTATFAILFAMATKVGIPEVVGLAALFHDLALTPLPRDIQITDLKTLSPEHQKAYLEHPLDSVRMLQNKRMIVEDQVKQTIEQHHEMFNGKGFPKGLSDYRVNKNAQILSLADQFDELVTVRPGRPRLSPLEALKTIEKTGSIDPLIIEQAIQFITSSE